MARFHSTLLKNAATNAVIREAQTRFASNPNFPKEPEGVQQLFGHLDQLVPKEVQASGVGKQIYFFLLRLLFKANPPGFVLGEDDYKVKPLLKNYCLAVNRNQLEAVDRNLDKYRNLEELENVLDSIGEKKTPKLQEGQTSLYTAKEQAIIDKATKVVYNSGGWKVYKLPKGNSPLLFSAARLLCDNPRHGVSWCVGRGTTMYLTEGDFFVIEYNGVSKYAISSHQGNDFTIWNARDTPIYTAHKSESPKSKETCPRLRAAAQKSGIPFDPYSFSVVPQEILEPLRILAKKEPALSIISPGALATDDKALQNVYRLLHEIQPRDFVLDMNDMYHSSGGALIAQNLMGAATSKRVNMDFTGTYQDMDLYCFYGYIEAASGQGMSTLPAELDDTLIRLMETWISQSVKKTVRGR